MKIMKSSWVHNVWYVNEDENVPGTSTQFDEHQAPAFYNLRVSTSGLRGDEKNEVKKSIDDGGGIFHGGYSHKFIDVVITQNDAINSDKCVQAQKDKIPCVSIEWVRNSLSMKKALPFENFEINRMETDEETQAMQASSTDPQADQAIQELAAFISGAKDKYTDHESSSGIPKHSGLREIIIITFIHLSLKRTSMYVFQIRSCKKNKIHTYF